MLVTSTGVTYLVGPSSPTYSPPSLYSGEASVPLIRESFKYMWFRYINPTTIFDPVKTRPDHLKDDEESG